MIIWSVRVIPKRNPKFHKKEIDAGVGKSVRAALSGFNMGLILVSCFFIKSLRW